MLVTFVWRGTPSTRNVVVLGSFGARPFTDGAMTQLGESDVWYVTLRVPAGARFAYGLSPNDPMTIDPPRAAQRMASMQSDPLNPNRWECQPDSEPLRVQSMVELPGAPPAAVDRPPRGHAGRHRRQAPDQERAAEQRAQHLGLHAARLSRRRRANALLVLFDEGAYLNSVPTPVILDNLIAASKIPPTVAVLIANPSQETRIEGVAAEPGVRRLPRQGAGAVGARALHGDHGSARRRSSPDRATAGLPRPTPDCGTRRCSATSCASPDRSGGRRITTSDATPTRRPKPAGSPRSSSGVRSCRCGSGWMRRLRGGHQRHRRSHSRAEPAYARRAARARATTCYYRQFASGHDYLNWRGTLADGLMALIGRSDRCPSR